MASFHTRKTKAGFERVRVRLFKTVSDGSVYYLGLTFDDLEAARAWVAENEPKFQVNPGHFMLWIVLLKREAYLKGWYKIEAGKRVLVKDHLVLTRDHYGGKSVK